MISATVASWPCWPGCGELTRARWTALEVGPHARHALGTQDLDPEVFQAVVDQARHLAGRGEAAVHAVVVVADAQGRPVGLAAHAAELVRDEVGRAAG